MEKQKEKAKGLLHEFKVFISRGNVIDLAVGVIIGSAFTAIVNSLVNDIVMPVIGVIIGGINFEDLKWVITPASGDVAECAIRYGTFLQSIVNFLLIALVVFTMVKLINLTHRKKAARSAACSAGRRRSPARDPRSAQEIIRLCSARSAPVWSGRAFCFFSLYIQ